MATVQELSDSFESLDLRDDEALLKWLMGIFRACDAEKVAVPNRRKVASAIGRTRMLLPNPDVPNNPPRGDQLEWLVRESLGTLILDTAVNDQVEAYAIAAFAIESWLIGQR